MIQLLITVTQLRQDVTPKALYGISSVAREGGCSPH